MEELIARNDEALSRSTIGRMLTGKDNPRWGRWDSLIRCLAKRSIYVDHDVDMLIKRLHALYVGSGPGTPQTQPESVPPPILDAQSEQAVAAAWREAQDEIASARAVAAVGEVASVDREEGAEQRSETVTSAEVRADNGFAPVALPMRVRLALVLLLYSVCGLLAGGVVGVLVSSQVLGGWALTGPVAGITVGLFTGEVMAGLSRHQGSDAFAVRHPTPGLTGLGDLVGLAAGTAVGGTGATHLADGLILGCGAGIGMGALMGSVVLAGRALDASFSIDVIGASARGDTSDLSGPWKPTEGRG